MPHRRGVLIGIGGIVTGALGMSAFSQPSSATQITVQELSVSDTTADVTDRVTGLSLRVSGEYSVDAKTPPDRVILRCEATAAGGDDYQQVAASTPSDSSASFATPFSMQADLLDLSGLSADRLTPDTVGATTETTIQIRLRLVVRHDGHVTKTATVTDTATVQVTKTVGDVSLGLEATGNLSVAG